MGIFMYDVKFGDCFQIEKDGSCPGIVVDFGSKRGINEWAVPPQHIMPHQLKMAGRFDNIISHFRLTQPQKLLLSHFHDDHLSGLRYMMDKNNVYHFEELLIPDIFSTTEFNKAIVLLFIEEFLDMYRLPYKTYTLLDLAKYLCINNTVKVDLLSRGDDFDNFIALWPDKNRIQQLVGALFDSVELDISIADMEELLRIADDIGNFIQSRRQPLEASIDDRIRELDSMRERINTIFSRNAERLRQYKGKRHLKVFGHTVNIVFQNKTGNSSNMLFTGDVDYCAMKKIKCNFDSNPRLNLFEKYKYIKIPHHGTGPYFFDYSPYKPQNILISNGSYRNWEISSKYFATYSGISNIYCTNGDSCAQSKKAYCCCNNSNLVYPEDYVYIK